MKFVAAFLAPLSLAMLAYAGPSPYAGEQSRAIKALSENEISALRAGQGMGLARAAELNSYPGPRHVLNLAGDLGLSPTQIEELTRVFDAMKAAAVPLGRAVVERETELDRMFTTRQATTPAVLALTREIGRLLGDLRAVHLNAHIATLGILHPGQITRYNELRGYASPAPAAPLAGE